MKIIGVVSLVVLGIVGWFRSERALKNYVTRVYQHMGSQSRCRIRLCSAPPWMSPLLKEELCTLAATGLSNDPMDHSGLEQLRRRFGDSVWVRQVQQVRRIEHGVVLIQATYRQPVALIQSRFGYHPIDAQQVRLPGVYLASQLKRVGLPVIEGVGRSPCAVGEVWASPKIQAGLAISKLLSHQPYANQIRAIDVSRQDRRGQVRITLLIHGGGQVRWGYAPGHGYPVEAPDTYKLQSLASLYQRCGSLDAGGQVVDVFGDTVLVHRRVSSQTAMARNAYMP